MIKPDQIVLVGAIERTCHNYIETQYITLIKSLRRWGGVYSDIDIFLLEPTNNMIDDRFKDVLATMNVTITTWQDHNTVFCDYNYNNMPIACNYFSNNLSNRYDYMLWLDCDVIVMKQPLLILEPIETVACFPCEWHFDNQSAGLKQDIELYSDMLSRALPEITDEHVPYNTWFILAACDNRIWRNWYDITFRIQNNINSQQQEHYKFHEYGTENFSNRIEEIAFSIAVQDMHQCIPIGAGMLHTPDVGTCGLKIDSLTRHQYNIINDFIDNWVPSTGLCELETDLLDSNTPIDIVNEIIRCVGKEQSRSGVYNQGDDMWCLHYNDTRYIDMLNISSKYKTFIKSMEIQYGNLCT